MRISLGTLTTETGMPPPPGSRVGSGVGGEGGWATSLRATSATTVQGLPGIEAKAGTWGWETE